MNSEPNQPVPSQEIAHSVAKMESLIANFQSQIERIQGELTHLSQALPELTAALSATKEAAAQSAAILNTHDAFRNSVQRTLQEIVQAASHTFQSVQTLGILPPEEAGIPSVVTPVTIPKVEERQPMAPTPEPEPVHVAVEPEPAPEPKPGPVQVKPTPPAEEPIGDLDEIKTASVSEMQPAIAAAVSSQEPKPAAKPNTEANSYDDEEDDFELDDASVNALLKNFSTPVGDGL